MFTTESIPNEQHIFHHSDSDGIRINVKVEKNTKGFNYEATVTGAKTVEDAMQALKSAQGALEQQYGASQTLPF
jgi:hypothetical protein